MLQKLSYFINKHEGFFLWQNTTVGALTITESLDILTRIVGLLISVFSCIIMYQNHFGKNVSLTAKKEQPKEEEKESAKE